MPEGIEIPDLNKLRRHIKELGDIEATREYKLAGYNAMANVVVPKAKANASTAMEHRAADTLRPSKTITGGAVRFGRGFAGAFGAEFGAMQDQLRNTSRGPMLGWNQFKAWRGNGSDAGYFLWPAIRDNAAEIIAEFDKGLEPLYRRLWDQGG